MKKNTQIPTECHLKDMYYSLKDPRIEKYMQIMEREVQSFCDDFQGKTNYIKNVDLLFDVITRFEKVYGYICNNKPYLYASIKRAKNSNDEDAKALVETIGLRVARAFNKIGFFYLIFRKVSKKKKEEFLRSRKLLPYRYLLHGFFSTEHDLPEGEESLISLLEIPAYEMPIRSGEEIRGGLIIHYHGKNISLGEALEMMPNLPPRKRKQLDVAINKKLKTVAVSAASELNTIVTFRKINDERRGYKYVFSSTFHEYGVDEEDMIKFIQLVTSLFSISHRFYALHARLLGKRKINICDVDVLLGKVKMRTDFSFAFDFFCELLVSLGFKKEARAFKKMALNGHIDVYPKKGKVDNAFCTSPMGRGTPIVILLNYVNDLRSLVHQLCHEGGHFVEHFMTNKNLSFYQGLHTILCEAPSTFMEEAGFDLALKKSKTDRDRLIITHMRLMNYMLVIFRQVALFNFEVEMHNTIRQKGRMSSSEIACLAQKHLQSYLGPAVKVTKDDGLIYVHRPHFRDAFYECSYPIGSMISMFMNDSLKNNLDFIENIRNFFLAGSSDAPLDIAKKVGVNLKSMKFFKNQLMKINSMIDVLEKLSESKLKK